MKRGRRILSYRTQCCISFEVASPHLAWMSCFSSCSFLYLITTRAPTHSPTSSSLTSLHQLYLVFPFAARMTCFREWLDWKMELQWRLVLMDVELLVQTVKLKSFIAVCPRNSQLRPPPPHPHPPPSLHGRLLPLLLLMLLILLPRLLRLSRRLSLQSNPPKVFVATNV